MTPALKVASISTAPTWAMVIIVALVVLASEAVGFGACYFIARPSPQPGVVPVVPTPGPKPGPTPSPQAPAPIPVPGLRVLFLYERDDQPTYSPGQTAVLMSTEIRKHLDAACAKGADGATPEYRFYDKDVDASAESAIWQAAVKRPHAKTPWLLVSNGTTGTEEPIEADATPEKVLARIKEFEVKSP